METLNESVSINDINDAMDNHKRVIINYRSHGEDLANGPRVAEVYAYGLTKAGNPVLRIFQPYGDTMTKVPGWKFCRLDRIIGWKTTNQTFSHPASFYYHGLGDFNPNDDRTMSVVYKITKFDDGEGNDDIKSMHHSAPKTKTPYKTDTEYRMERLRQQLRNPITLSDLKAQQATKLDGEYPRQTTGPKTKEEPRQQTTQQPQTAEKPQGTELYRTDTERGLERLKQQLQNPVKLSDYMKQQKNADNGTEQPSRTGNANELSQLRQRLGDTSKPISLRDLNDRLSNGNEPYRTDTERGMERLRKQLDNPRKIDLSKIPRR